MQRFSQGMWIQPPAIPFNSIQGSENRYLCPRFDAVVHHIWAILALKIAEACIQLWCMLMLGLGPTWLRLNHPSPSLMAAKVSDYGCHPKINRLQAANSAGVHSFLYVHYEFYILPLVLPFLPIKFRIEPINGVGIVMFAADQVVDQVNCSGRFIGTLFPCRHFGVATQIWL